MPEANLGSFLDDFFDKKGVCIYSIRGKLPAISPENRPSGASGRWSIAQGGNKDEWDLKVALELSKRDVGDTASRQDEGKVSYPKLPSAENDKVSYPALELPKEEKKAAPDVPTQVSSKDPATVQEQLAMMNECFAKVFGLMEKMESRVSTVERLFSNIQQQRNNV